MIITPLTNDLCFEAAALFSSQLHKLRTVTPEIPVLYEDPSYAREQLAWLCEKHNALAAIDGGRIAGFLGWFPVDNFRSTGRTAAYSPEWAHATVDDDGMQMPIYRSLYAQVAKQATATGCDIHAITLLAQDPAVQNAWFWNGFGLHVVDGVRSLNRLITRVSQNITVRMSVPSDAAVLAVLDAEHWRHYSQPPIFMIPRVPQTPAERLAFIQRPAHSIWLAMYDDTPAGFIQFEPSSEGAAAILQDPESIAITGAYVRSAYRGLHLASALLDAALKDYAMRGFQRCTVDFESFNPEAASFWMKYFQPVCYSVVRVPETTFAK